MKKLVTLYLIIVSLSVSSAQNLLSNPQKIIIDSERNRFLVSNFESSGDIVQIDSTGKQTYFVENAGFIDAMEIIGDTVYGSGNNGKILGYDLNTGSMVFLMNLYGDGIQFLSGFVADSEGQLFVSERFGNRIFKINPKTQEYTVFAQGNGIDQPNGLLYEKDKNRLLVCLDKVNPSIMAVNLENSKVTTLVTTTLAGCDGIARDSEGNYYLTGYYLPGIYKFDPEFQNEPEMIFVGRGIVYPTYYEKNKSLLYTKYDGNSWGELALEYISVSETDSPTKYSLSENYPNPFNPSTTIRYTLPETSEVKIEIFDLQGQRLEVLVNSTQSAGDYNKKFDASNFPSGVYLYRLTANHFSKTKKMTLLK